MSTSDPSCDHLMHDPSPAEFAAAAAMADEEATDRVAAPAASAAAAATPTETPAASSSSPNKRKKKKYNKYPPVTFNDMFFELMVFRSQTGHTRVPSSHTQLHRWVTQIRNQRKNNIVLTERQLQVLNSIDFVWDVPRHDRQEKWKEHYEQLVAYNAQHGHVNVPQATPLGKWVKTQRENYQRHQKGSVRKTGKPFISQERIELLERLNFQWAINPPVVGWEARFEALQQYRAIHGNANVPQGYKPDVALGRWCMKQRSQYSLRRRGLKNQLTEDRIMRLENLGFLWSVNKKNKENEQTQA